MRITRFPPSSHSVTVVLYIVGVADRCDRCQSTLPNDDGGDVPGGFVCRTCEREMQRAVRTPCARCGTKTKVRHGIGEGPTLVTCTKCQQEIDEEKRRERALPWPEETR